MNGTISPGSLAAQLPADEEFRWYFNLLFPSLEIDLWEARDAEGLEAAEREAQLGLRFSWEDFAECSDMIGPGTLRRGSCCWRSDLPIVTEMAV